MALGHYTDDTLSSKAKRTLQLPTIEALLFPADRTEFANRSLDDMPFVYQRPNARKIPKLHGFRTRDGSNHSESNEHKSKHDGVRLPKIRRKSRKRPDLQNLEILEPGHLYRKPQNPATRELPPIAISQVKPESRYCLKPANLFPEISPPCPETQKVKPKEKRPRKILYLEVVVPF